MKAARLYGPYDVRIEEVPRPASPGPEEVVMQVEFVGLCGTDATQYTSATRIPLDKPHPVSGQKAPIILGHEMVGTVIEVGSAVTALSVGQRVVPGAAWWCDTCEQCWEGRSNICQETFLYGIHADGGLAELVCLPANMCIPVPEACRPEAAVLAQPLAVALHALDRVTCGPDDLVALFGCGGMGSLLLAAWKNAWQGIWHDVHVNPPALVVIDTDAQRQATADAFGARLFIDASQQDPVQALLDMTEGKGVAVAIEATGSPLSVLQAIASVKCGGQILQLGIPHEAVPLPLAEMVLAEKSLQTTNGQICQEHVPDALDLLTETNLADQLPCQIIALDDLVEQGLKPLAEQRAPTRILVRLSVTDGTTFMEERTSVCLSEQR